MDGSGYRMVVIGLLLIVLATGCTLAGADAAPLTPVGGTGASQPTATPTVEILPTQTLETLPVPTDSGPIDVFGTQTAVALTPGGDTTTEPGGAVTPPGETPTQAITPVPQVSTTPTVPGTTCPPTHTVQQGETLYRIALKYGLTYQELAAANGITNPDRIMAGMVLTIPGCGGTTGGGTTSVDLMPGDTIADNGDIIHIVQQGENLYRIALHYGVNWQVLAAYNKISGETIYVGQEIRIPTK